MNHIEHFVSNFGSSPVNVFFFFFQTDSYLRMMLTGNIFYYIQELFVEQNYFHSSSQFQNDDDITFASSDTDFHICVVYEPKPEKDSITLLKRQEQNQVKKILILTRNL